MLDLSFDFVPLAVDTLRVPSEWVMATLQNHARQISMRFTSTAAIATIRIRQKLSFAVLISATAANLACMSVQPDERGL